MTNKVDLNLLFVVHDASRTGAPIVLLHFLRWLKKNTDITFTTLIMQHGEMDDDFAALGSVVFWDKQKYYHTSFGMRLLSRINKLFKDEPLYINFPKKLSACHFDLIYLNTVAANSLALTLKSVYNCPVLCHIHENEFTIDNHYPNYLNDEIKNSIDHYIAVSESTKNNLVNNHKIPQQSIDICYEFVPTADFCIATKSAQKVREELFLTTEFIVGGSGLTTWRKGIDLFLQLAFRIDLLDVENNIKFIWVGKESDEFINQREYELKRLGLQDKIIFTGVSKSPSDFFQLFNVFALTSREDPFPLVCLEAASMGIPVFCFEQAGGMTEFVALGAGKVFPYGNIDAMAGEIIKFAKSAGTKKLHMPEALSLVQKFDVNTQSPGILKVINEVITNA